MHERIGKRTKLHKFYLRSLVLSASVTVGAGSNSASPSSASLLPNSTSFHSNKPVLNYQTLHYPNYKTLNWKEHDPACSHFNLIETKTINSKNKKSTSERLAGKKPARGRIKKLLRIFPSELLPPVEAA